MTPLDLQSRLSQLQSADDLRRLFADLSYEVDFAPVFLPRETKADLAAAEALAAPPELLAQFDEFVIIYAPLLNWKTALSSQRLLISRLIQDFPFALWVFSDEGGQNWHLVNVKRGAGSGQTAMGRHILRRFSFARGQNAGRTSVERLSQIDLANFIGTELEVQARHDSAFDVEAVTRDFFRDYKLVFEDVETRVALKENIERRAWTQRLFNRLMFLRFLERKGWLQFEGDPDYLRALYRAAERDGESLLNDRLFYAFFYGLGIAAHDGAASDAQIHNRDYLVGRRGQVPYLNGGLFEQLENDDTQTAATLPNAAFAGILDLFDRYNFTITESTPFDQEVGIDPEMLGKVFEELTNERTDSGSYYTPRVVVSFMARAALKGYLGKHDAVDAIETFVESGDASGLKRPREILKALEEVRVCDPACGSGAYLLGMMQELLRLRDALFVAHKIDHLEIYDRKLEIIQRNLYGADLTEFAVNIAMLRLWLSLVVDYNGDVEDLPALPNLRYKIGQGDSLTAPNPTDMPLQKELYQGRARELSLLHSEYFEESYRRSKGEVTRGKAEIQTDISAKSGEIKRILGRTAPDDAHDWRLQFAEVFAHDGFDIVIANPPYGASVADATRDIYFARARGESQSKDTYGLFMARGLQLLKPGGWFTYIVSDTWRTIKSHKPLRRRLLEQASVSHVLDLPGWIFGAMVNTGVLTFQKNAPSENHALIAADLRGLANEDWDGLGAQLREVARTGDDRQTLYTARYSYPQSTIGTYDNASFFIAAPALYALMSDAKFRPLGEVAQVKQGLATADNEYYLRKRAGARGSYAILSESQLLSETEIAALTDDEKLNGVDPKRYGGRCFVPYDKGGGADAQGGWMPNYHVPTEYFIDWSEAAVERLKTATIADVKTRKGQENRIKKSDRTQIAGVIRSPHLYFQRGMTFSRTGIYAPTFRLNAASAFDTEGSAVFSEKYQPEALLGLLCSTFSRYLVKNMIGHTVHTQVDELKEIPLPRLNSVKATELESLVASIIEKQKLEPRYAYWLDEGPQIDALVYGLYGLDEAAIREVEMWYCRRYERLARAQGVWDQVVAKYGVDDA